MDKNHTNEHYTQPPVAFYLRVFQLRAWKKVILVSVPPLFEGRDGTNPVWRFFLDRQNRPEGLNMVFQMSSSIREDMRTLWCARSFLTATSTLSGMMIASGPFLKNVFTMGDCSADVAKRTRCRRFKVDGYSMEKWENTPQKWAALTETADPRKVRELH